MKKTKALILSLLLLVCFGGAQAKDYNASLFGIKSNGTTMNTTAIQKAIDYIHEQGGGRLVFYVGRYLTGSIELKSNVTIHLNEGAVLLGSTNPYDYRQIPGTWLGLILANKAENIGVTGRGVIDGQGRETSYNYIDQIQKGVIKDELKYDRPASRPTLIFLRECKNVEINNVTWKNSAFWVQIYDQCENLNIDRITVDSKAFWNNDGIDIVDCNGVKLTNSFFDATDDAICLKSHSHEHMCENIEIRNCVARSSASGIKFGTVSAGGYKNIRIINNKVYDTFRSAFTIATPDGGVVENILVDSLYAYNVGNAIFLRIGNRWTKGSVGSIDGVTIRNMYCELSDGKPDAGYEYEGPVEDLPRNISPASIVGLKGYDIRNVKLENVTIVTPGGGNPYYAKVGTSAKELDAIPEMADRYPEFSQFKELPAWGFYIRHAKDIAFDNVKFIAKNRDYRPAIVTDDVKGLSLADVTFEEPGAKKKQIHTYQTTNIQINK